MPTTLTWLHISDLHARLKNDWDSAEIVASLVKDLRSVSSKNNLRPDFVFFTGDLAFGSTKTEKLADQYALAQQVLDAILTAFDPPIPKRNLYLVPGNHDVDRGEITPGEDAWLRDKNRSLPEVVDAMQASTKQWRAWMDRFNIYRKFLQSYGLAHLKPDGSHLIWSDAQNIGSHRVGICGFNSAWSASGDDDKGNLWAGIQFQASENVREMGPVNVSIALIHHPGNWFVAAEDPMAMRYLRQKFNFVLHGHEHQEWIEVGPSNVLVSAGACYESSWMDNGYNWVHLDLDAGTGAVWLREWDKIGRGWVPKNIANRTANGVWPLRSLDFLSKSDRDSHGAATEQQRTAVSEAATQFEHFTALFCRNVIDRLDYLELFGCDIPKELQRHQLSVAYVSLNFTPREPLQRPARRATKTDENALPENKMALHGNAYAGGSASVQTLLEHLPPTTTRLTILGPAGAGKSTLLRWCAMHAAKQVLDILTPAKPVASPKPLESGAAGPAAARVSSAWCKVPLLIRLRDYKDGRLPAAADLPKILAKHLQAAPSEWITSLLASGEALVLLDGVDEVHSSVRAIVATEIEELVRTYPTCTYIVTSRPGAIPDDWLDRSGFQEVLVEPMGRGDREEFIDKWYRSAALELGRKPRVSEDLSLTAASLKAELSEQPDLGMLASNPLICAMICALYRERQETLPESPSELCEALVHMLVHRREKETPDLSDAHFQGVWRALKYSQKKAILADMAWEMVVRQDSTMERADAVDIARKALLQTPGYTGEEAEEVLRAVVERSGLLRPAGEDRVEFIHNTLKEFLAAGRAVEHNNVDTCLANADDPAWQPMILFALSLAPEGFNSALVGALLARLGPAKPRKRPVTRADKDHLALETARAFFLVRCRKSVKRLSPEFSSGIEELTARLLPPAYMQDVELLAQLGSKLLVQASGMFDSPKWWSKQDARTATRCLRLLRLINAGRARSFLGAIQQLPSDSTQLTSEWMLASAEVADAKLAWPFANKTSVRIEGWGVRDLRPLQGVGIRELALFGTSVQDLGSLGDTRLLERVVVTASPLADISPLGHSKHLRYLVVSGTRVSDLSPLDGIANLEVLGAVDCPISSLAGITRAPSLGHLDLEGTPLSIVPSDVDWPTLHTLDIQRTPIASLDFARKCPSLKTLWAGGSAVEGLEPLAETKQLRRLVLRQTKVASLLPLASCKSLSHVSVSWTNVSDLSPLSLCTQLSHLDIDNTAVDDLEPLSQLTKLLVLNAAGSKISNLRPLADMRSLRTLYVERTAIDDLSRLSHLPDLSTLVIAEHQLESLVAGGGFTGLKHLLIAGHSQETRLAKFRAARPNVLVGRAPIRSIPRSP